MIVAGTHPPISIDLGSTALSVTNLSGCFYFGCLYRPDEAPGSTINYWSKQPGTASIETLDNNDAVIRRLSSEAVKGMNSFEWDLLVDQELALAVEASALDKADEASETTSLEKTPYAESARLGHAMYAIPGDYTVRINVGDDTDSTELKIKAPKAYEPRFKEPYELRGKK